MSRWHFAPKRPSDKTRDPVTSEFFSSDAIKNAGEALVREGIQNSLDARQDPKSKASVRLYVSEQQAALTPARHREWFGSAWPHYRANKNGLRPASLIEDEPCVFLTFEDFSTTGLTGDRSQYQPVDGSVNAFFNFFRAEGKTDKGGDDRGRWGVGKQVFPRSSRAQTFFGYTETDDGGFLMGGCILKHHFIGETCFKPDGFWGSPTEVDGDTLVLPVSDAALLEAFRKDFRLQRKSGQRGLSVVVPWLDMPDDGRDRRAFKRNTLALAVLEGYFIPIIEDRLEVVVEDPSGSLRISRETYRDVLEALAGETQGAGGDITRVKHLIALAEISGRGEATVVHLAPCPTQKAHWTADMLSPELADEMRTLLAAGTALKVTATLSVRPKGVEALVDTFSCLVQKQPQLNHRPCHVREDIIVPNVDCSRVAGYCCIVRIDDGPLATLLGDAEGPAHTEWQASSRNFKDKYIYGGMAIEFVSNFSTELIRRIHATSKDLDRSLLLDLFQDRGPAPREDVPKPKPKPGEKVPPPEVWPVASPLRFRIVESKDGFSVSSVEDRLPVGTILRIRAAYETTKGNPFAAYDENDFRFGDGFAIETEGCRTKFVSPNEIWLSVDALTFRLSVAGFDVNRDIIVRGDRLQTQATADTETELVE